MTPTNRKELIEVMARAIDPDRIELSPGHADCDICQDARKTLLESAEAALTALEQSGCEVVPRVATVDMLIAGTETWLTHAAYEDRSAADYTAMLSANPFKQQDV